MSLVRLLIAWCRDRINGIRQEVAHHYSHLRIKPQSGSYDGDLSQTAINNLVLCGCQQYGVYASYEGAGQEAIYHDFPSFSQINKPLYFFVSHSYVSPEYSNKLDPNWKTIWESKQ